MNRQRFLISLLSAPTMARCRVAWAHTPGPVRIVVGYPAGAVIDALARLVAAPMAATLQRPVIIENRPGAGGRIANELVKAAPPDGATLLLTPSATMAIFPHSYAGRLRYDPFRDFTPVAHLCSFQVGLAVGRHVPVSTLADYVDWVRADPAANGFYASAAPGSTPHFVGVMLARAAGLQLTHVTYKGTAAAMLALTGGEVPALTTGVGDLRTLRDSGHARVLAVNGEQRDPALADVPTFREQGYDLVSTSWYSLFAPAGLPAPMLQQLSAAALSALADAALRRRIAAMGLQPTGHGPARLADILRADHRRWGETIRETGFEAER
jgi:tripartite-type tricarboxylate transporter receptor subunit TctC